MLMPQLASDNFTRANENPLSGGGVWSQFSSVANWGPAQIVSNKVETTVAGQNNDMIYTGIVWPDAQWSEVTVSVCSSSSFVGCSVRASIANFTSYRLFWSAAGALGSSGTLTLQKANNGTFTTLAQTLNFTLNVGDKIRLVASGSGLFGLVNGNQQLRAVDASFTSGSVGILSIGVSSITNGQISGWSGGSVVQQTRITSFTDNFTRANENPLGNGNWSVLVETTSNPLKIVSNLAEVSVTSARNQSYVSSLVNPNDQWAEITMGGTVNSTAAIAVFARGTSGAGVYNFYRAIIGANAASIQGFTGGAGTNTLAALTNTAAIGTFVSGDKLRIEVAGSIIAAFYNNILVVIATSNLAPTGSGAGISVNPQGTLTFAQFALFTTGYFSSLPNLLMMMGCGT